MIENIIDFTHNEEDTWKEGLSDGLTSSCIRCHKYPIIIDYTVSDEFWEKHIPDSVQNNVICLDCLMDLAGKYETLQALERIQITLNRLTIDVKTMSAYIYDKE